MLLQSMLAHLAPHRVAAAAILAFALGLAAGPTPAGAVAVTTTYYPVAVTCTSTGQVCTPAFEVPVTTNAVLQLQFTAAASHCSAIAVAFGVNGSYGLPSAPLNPGESTPIVDAGPVIPGTYLIAVQATGVLGGCNTGSLASWGGTLAVSTSAGPPPPPPLPMSKDQCKGAGWQSFGVFKNQGDCVSFVATGGKNPPAN